MSEVILAKIKQIYLDWFNSDCDQVSKHTADMMYQIGEELKKVDEAVPVSECVYPDREEGYYPITSLHRDDIIACYEGSDEEEDVRKAVAELTEDQMKYMAKKMADSFCDCCYWDALKCRFEYTKYDDWKKDKEEKENDRRSE